MKSFVSKWAAWLIGGATLLIWLPAVFNNFVEWDDAIFITSNPRFNPPTWGTICYYWTHAGSNLYIPITYTFWAVLARVGQVSTPDVMGTQLNPYLFHLGQVAMHVVATVAIFGILKRLLGSIEAAMAGAMLFAVHPLQVQAVAFIGATNTPLAGALALTAIWLQGNGGKKWKWTAAILFALATLAKPTAVVAPAILILLDVIVEKRTVRQAVGNTLPWIILVIPCLIWTKMIQSHAADDAGPIWSRPLVAGDAMFFYVRKFFYPWPMAIDYGRTTKEALASVMIWWAWLAPAALVALAWLSRRRMPVVAAGIIIFFVAMLPNSGLVPFEYQHISTTADHYVYLSMLGAAIVLGSWVKNRRSIATAVAVIALGVWVVGTEFQIGVWRDGETLFRHAIAVNPSSWMARTNLGMILKDRSPQEAIVQCRTAVDLNPRSWLARDNLSALLFARNPDQAIAQCKAALQLDPQDANAYNNLGAALVCKGDRDAALTAFAEAYRLAPEDRNIASNYRHAAAESSSTTKHVE